MSALTFNAPVVLPLLAVAAGCVAFLLHQLDGWLDRRHTVDPRFERMRRALRERPTRTIYVRNRDGRLVRVDFVRNFERGEEGR